MNWRDLKPGDRVRVTFEIDVTLVGDNFVLLGDNDDRVTVEGTPADTATWEVIDPPFRVGPAEYRPAKKRCEVLAFANGFAWVRYDTCGSYDTQPTHYFRNVSEGGE